MKSLKQVTSIISMVLKSKTRAIKTRLMLYKILHDKKVLLNVRSKKVHQIKQYEDEDEPYYYSPNQDLDLNFEAENDFAIGNDSGSFVNFATSQEEELEFRYENEIDKAADVFIRRFHKQMKIQKQDSFKRYQEMLDRGA